MTRRVLSGGSLGLGESYLDGWWDCSALDQFFDRLLSADLHVKVKGLKHLFWIVLKAKIMNLQSQTKARDVGRRHYDIGNDLYASMLNGRMVYSCGYWKNAENLETAQEAKLDLICRKVALKPGMRILDMGCGWGGFARFAAERYGAEVIGVTVSQEQVKWANQVCRELPVDIRLQDYRNLNEPFDAIVSVGMFEHVGNKNYRTLMQTVHRCLTPDGLFLLHTIGRNTSAASGDPWTHRYIFPNYVLPSANQITSAVEGLFVLEDWHSFGQDYDRTLMAWFRNFSGNWDQIKDKYGPRFYRMWSYYLLCCAGSFRARRNQLWQVVFSKEGLKGGTASIR